VSYTCILKHISVPNNYHYDLEPRAGPSAWGLGEGLTTPRRKKKLVTKCYTRPRKVGPCEQSSEPSGSLKGGNFLLKKGYTTVYPKVSGLSL